MYQMSRALKTLYSEYVTDDNVEDPAIAIDSVDENYSIILMAIVHTKLLSIFTFYGLDLFFFQSLDSRHIVYAFTKASYNIINKCGAICTAVQMKKLRKDVEILLMPKGTEGTERTDDDNDADAKGTGSITIRHGRRNGARRRRQP